LSLLDAVMGLMGNKQQTSKNILFSTKNRSKKIIYEVRKLEHIEITKREDHIEMQECTTTARLTDRQAEYFINPRENDSGLTCSSLGCFPRSNVLCEQG